MKELDIVGANPDGLPFAEDAEEVTASPEDVDSEVVEPFYWADAQPTNSLALVVGDDALRWFGLQFTA